MVLKAPVHADRGRLEQLASDPLGVVRRPVLVPLEPSDPMIPVATVRVGVPSRTASRRIAADAYGNLDGAGTDLDPEVAKLKAAAEGLERYASCIWVEEDLHAATAQALAPDVVPFEDLPVCSPDELAASSGICAPDPSSVIRWTRGWRLSDGRPTWLPAIMTFGAMQPDLPGERFWAPISTGCAFGVGTDDAVRSGLYETIERDSLAITWLARIGWPRIRFGRRADLPAPLREVLERIDDSALRVEIYDATTDLGIPTFYCLAINEGDVRLRTVVGAATSPDPLTGIIKSILEAHQIRLGLRYAIKRNDRVPADVLDFYQTTHGALYLAPARCASAFSFLGQRGTVDLEEVLSRSAPHDPLEALNERGVEAYAADLTTTEVRSIDCSVVRVLVPRLQPLAFVQRMRYLGSRRLAEACRNLDAPIPEAWNPLPQPFA